MIDAYGWDVFRVHLVIHIGMPRTASTFLQQRFFPKVDGFTFYGVDTCHYSDAFQKLLYQDDSLFDESEFEKTTTKSRSGDAIPPNALFVGQSLYLNTTNGFSTASQRHPFYPETEMIRTLPNPMSLL